MPESGKSQLLPLGEPDRAPSLFLPPNKRGQRRQISPTHFQTTPPARQLFPEQIRLIEHQHNRRPGEPPAAGHTLKNRHGLLQPIHRMVFTEGLVIFGKGDEEEEEGDGFETVSTCGQRGGRGRAGGGEDKPVDPFPTLGALPSYVEDPVVYFADAEGVLLDLLVAKSQLL